MASPMRYFIFFLFQLSLFASDFDCIVIGTSPFSLFEALYQHHTGKKVLILEASEKCGGAWKGIDICGIQNVDLGCHQIGKNVELKKFLEEYVGCSIVCLDNPHLEYQACSCKNGWYFSKGCFELIENLLKLIEQTDIVLLTQNRAERILINEEKTEATVICQRGVFETSKVFVTPMSAVNVGPSMHHQSLKKSRYYHLYCLIQDPTPPKFTYHMGNSKEVCRMMNLSYFAQMEGSGRQLIAFQLRKEEDLNKGQQFIEELKEKKLIDESAYLLKEEPYIYESGSFHRGSIDSKGIIELLQTGHIQNLKNSIARWSKVLIPKRSEESEI